MRLLLVIYYLLEEYLLILNLKLKALIIKKIPEQWRYGKKGNVILLPGVHESWLALKSIADALNQKGFAIHVIPSLGQNTKTIEFGETELNKYINGNKLKNVVLIGHSKGGIIIRQYLSNTKYAIKIHKAFTIATPHYGSIFANVFRSTRQITPRAPFLEKLNSKPQITQNIINIYPHLDNHVVPNKNLQLVGAKNIKINIVGHTRILHSHDIIEIILEHLK